MKMVSNMKRRMDKYSNRAEKRTEQKSEIYDELKNITDINDDINVASTNEINLEGIKHPQKREDYKKIKHYEEVIKKEPIAKKAIAEELEQDEKVYDINKILEKAKGERVSLNDEERFNRIKNTQYDILSKLDFEEKEEPKDLVSEMFEDLVGKGETKVLEPVVEELTLTITEESEPVIEEEIDKSFFTSSMTLDKTNFDELENIEETVKFNNVLIKILLIVIFIILGGIAYYAVVNYM